MQPTPVSCTSPRGRFNRRNNVEPLNRSCFGWSRNPTTNRRHEVDAGHDVVGSQIQEPKNIVADRNTLGERHLAAGRNRSWCREIRKATNIIRDTMNDTMIVWNVLQNSVLFCNNKLFNSKKHGMSHNKCAFCAEKWRKWWNRHLKDSAKWIDMHLDWRL